MKYLLLILVIGLVAFMLGVKRARPARPATPKAEPPATPARPVSQEIVSCAHCGLHVPQAEALPGRGGLFCSTAHRAAYEAGHSA